MYYGGRRRKRTTSGRRMTRIYVETMDSEEEKKI
jgi:hypothetical protein